MIEFRIILPVMLAAFVAGRFWAPRPVPPQAAAGRRHSSGR